MLLKIKEFIKKEAVLTVSGILAVVSMFFVTPNAKYLSYIDFKTLSILLCLMIVMAGFRKIGVFSAMAKGFTDNTEQLIIGTNIGGLGTLIASMASLISYKYFAVFDEKSKGRYMFVFTGVNIAFLAALIIFYVIR